MDVLDSILLSMRLSGGVVFDARTSGDWCVASQFERQHCAPYFAIPETVVSYHYVRKGRLFAQLPGQTAVEIGPGSIVLFPRNDAHLLYTRPGLQVVDVADFIQPGAGGALNRIVMEFGSDETHLYCGWLGVPTGRHPLLNALPPMLVVDCDGHIEDWISSSLQIAASAWKNSPTMVAKISELLFAQAVRRYSEVAPTGSWMAAFRDPVVGSALAAIHARYAEDLDIETLAREAGVSRTVLGERFGKLLGEPPIRYCARWRMQMAANQLLELGASTADVGYRVGFASEAAFSRAFKRHFGEPPAAWRRRMDVDVTSMALA